MGRYFEEFDDGEVFVTRGRTITEADIMQYAGLCWDTQAEHTNAVFAKRGPFGERIGQQQLGLLIAHGLLDSLRILDGTLMSVLRLGWNYLNPMKIGDTLQVKQAVLEKREVGIEDGGLIAFQWETMNQRDQVVHRCTRSVLVQRRPVSAKGPARAPYSFRGLSDFEARPEVIDRANHRARSAPPEKKPEQRNRGKYFEEFEVGEELTTPARTVAEADTINYTILSWDTDPLHTDAVYAQSLGFGGMLAPLLLPIVFANGLGATLGFLAGTNRGALGDWWEFVRPVRVGDTLHFRQEIVSKQDAEDPSTGIVTFGMEMINERGEAVSRGERSALVARLPQDDAQAEPWNFVFGTPEELARK
jgi:acyl dehydratase